MKSPIKNNQFKGSHGFTLVEILVVIAIIAILAGVALPAVTGAIKKAKENAAMQVGRSLALGAFQFSNDNNQAFPGTTTSPAVSVTTSTAFMNLLYPTYVSNADAIYLAVPGVTTKYDGTGAILKANNGWDATVGASDVGLNSSDPDATPLIISTGSTITYGTAGTPAAATSTIPASSGTPFGTDGVAVAMKDGSAFFKGPAGSTTAITLNTSSFNPAQAYVQVEP